MKGVIYKYTFPDGKVYIGQTIRPLAVRHKEHITPSTGKVNIGFWDAWQKFGQAKLDVLETVEEQQSGDLIAKLNMLEIKQIEKHKATDPRYGYNWTSGGHATNPDIRILKKEFRKQFQEVWSERGRFFFELSDRIKDCFEGPVLLNEEQSLYVKNEVIPSILHPYDKYVRVSQNTLSLNGGRGKSASFNKEEAYDWLLFTVQDLCELEMNEVSQSVAQYVIANYKNIVSLGIIQQINKNGEIVKEYKSITEVMHALNLSYSTNIYNVLEGKQKTAYGYIWRYKNK